MERIDTHQTVKNLMAAGIHEKHAEAITIAINKSNNLATKEDISRLEASTKENIKDVKGEIKSLEKDVGALATTLDKVTSWGINFAIGIILLLIALAAEIALVGWYK